MNAAQDIGWLDLSLGYLILIIPLYFFYKYKTKLVKPTLIAVARMTIQLLLVGLYLDVIFVYNNPFVNIFWVVAMVFVAAFTTVKRSELNRKIFLIPILISLIISILFVDIYFLGFIIGIDFILEARYLIPITGMLIGNCLSNNIIALNSFYDHLSKEQLLYQYSIANGATRAEALEIFIRQALQKSLNPLIATTAVVGLISLPGMMTGQILGGSNPMVAIKYQIMIMITILVSTMLTVILSIKISNKFVFSNYDMPHKNLRAKKKLVK
jgi:putative ABC transport system permease protein